MSIKLSIIIPAYNEDKIIKASLGEIENYFREKPYDYEVIVVNDGSTDMTLSIVEKLSQINHRIKMLSNSSNAGKGFSVRRGILEAKGDYILLTDADLQIFISEIDEFVDILEKGFQIAIASRLIPGTELIGSQSAIRKIARDILSFIVKLLIVPYISDPQCGFKCFSRTAVQKIFKCQSINGFGFDIEMLYIAHKWKYKIKEIPIKWRTNKETKVKLFSDGLDILKDIAMVKIKSILGKYKNEQQ